LNKKNKILDRIDSPKDLSKLNKKEISLLCQEIRELIIEVVSKNGGHFSSPLGVVDLTVALHRVFDTPKDLIVWDVGHQSYPHKILTGRKDNFNSLRQFEGISGFCKIDESEYDVFGAGHASTSISAAVGMARARDLKKQNHKIIAVIGDGSMTGGLAYEGLNNAGILPSQFLLVLNDNQMSISPTVGSLSKYLTRVVTNPIYNKVREIIWDLTGKLPHIPKKVVRRLAHSIQDSLKNFLVPGMIFEELGLRYFGPIDGHNMDEMNETFENLKKSNFPAVVHVITKKGVGSENSEYDPLKYYSLSGKNITKVQDSTPDYSNVFGKTAIKLAQNDKEIVCCVAAMREGTGLKEFAEKYPDRFFDGGIAEGHITTFAAGLSYSGLKPIVAIYSTFLQRGYDMIIHDIALQNLPVLFCIDRGGLVGPDGPTHHGVFDISFLRTIPNIVICAPKDGNELQDLMFTGINHKKGPFAIRYPKSSSINYNDSLAPQKIRIGTWENIKKGDKIAILAVGSMVGEVEKALSQNIDKSINPTLINARYIKPIDKIKLNEISKNFSSILTIEEGSLEGGFGSAVLSYLTEIKYKGDFYKLGIPDNFIEHGDRSELLDNLGLSSSKILQKIQEISKKN
tara:strand:+ start:2380 stop:4257 length:1878 start_codon:yes stop_codon:yes gene_type:complete